MALPMLGPLVQGAVEGFIPIQQSVQQVTMRSKGGGLTGRANDRARLEAEQARACGEAHRCASRGVRRAVWDDEDVAGE